jgi:uncharacterized protein with PIN domain
MTHFTVRLRFHRDLNFFLKRRSTELIERRLNERTSIKDIIESCGVPHTEVDLILIDQKPAEFGRVVGGDTNAEIFPISIERDVLFPQNRLQTRNITTLVADGHLGKLVRDLRLLGIDVKYDRAADDRALMQTSAAESRALLTRDRRLLMHAAVRHGYYLRSQDPIEQTHEVLRRFNLSVAPFTRCLRCNGDLEPAEKSQIVERLEPLTKLHYDQFRRCRSCAQIYWSGSHFAKLGRRLTQLLDFRVTHVGNFG